MSEATPEPDERAPAGGDWPIYKRLLTYVRPYWLLFAVAVLGFLIGGAAEAYFTNIVKDLIDTWGSADLHAAWSIPLAMFLAALVRAFGAIVGEALLSMVSFNVVYNLRVQLFDQLLDMPSRYFDASTQGHLVSRLTFNVAQLRDTGTDALKTIVEDGIKLFVYFGWMLFLSWELTLIFVAAAPLLAGVVMFASRRFRRISKRIQGSMGDVTHVASEAVNGYRVVKVYGGEGYERTRFNRASRVNRQQSMKMAVTKVFSTQVNETLVAMAIALLVLFLFQSGIGSEMTKGEVVQFLSLAGLLARPIRKLSDVNAKLQRGLAAAEDVFSQLDEQVEEDPGTVECERVRGRIEFRDVRFSYQRSTEPVLKGVSLTVEPGQTVALVGRSGSGKSTIASLIPRFYDIDSGEILIDGTPIQTYKLRALRDQIALVNQQITLFNDTLARNIAYGGLAQASQEAIEEAVERAHATEFINRLPEGLDTIVGDNGVLLSGGQRQRVAVARALLKDAPILILDEATSALDTESERHIQAALDEVMKGRTTIVIAHRLSTIENADVIIVMDNGAIVEQGDHATLLAAGGAYAALYNAQFEEDALAGKASPAPSKPQLKRRQRTAAPRRVAARSIEHGWYEGAWWVPLAKPLSWVFGRASGRRRRSYATSTEKTWRAPVPVVVVGNITAGGTGKTPLVMALAAWLEAQGFTPGIVSRGYGASREGEVPPDGNPAEYGDEPVLMARRTNRPVYTGKNRVRAVQRLLAEHACDIILADDGLQHYALARDIEICVVDGQRGLGNGALMPAGPLREPSSRLEEVDLIVSNGEGFADADVVMHVEPVGYVALASNRQLGLNHIPPGTTVHAVAGIGNPARFVDSLKGLGLDVVLHAFPDHHEFNGTEILFDDDWPVIVTEKDAGKLINTGAELDAIIYLQVEARIGAELDSKLRALLTQHGISAP